MKNMRVLAALVAASWAGSACSSSDTGSLSGGDGGDTSSLGDTESTTDSDTDTDSTTVGDTDSQTDTTTFSDADTDADADTDTDADTDADAGSDMDGSTGDSGAQTDTGEEIACIDGDSDGWCLPFDCDDENPLVNPGADESPTGGIDDDCDESTDEEDNEWSDECAPVLHAVVRDFSVSHPDFEDYLGGLAEGLVQPTLGGDGNPVFASSTGTGATAQITSSASFAQWYETIGGVNLEFPVDLLLEEQATAGGPVWVYDSSAFFPLDGEGFGNEMTEAPDHNYHFTTEIHTVFTYEGGETFTFRGDDDLWLFIDGALAIDIGGVHGAVEASVSLDTFAAEQGMVVGEKYNLDLFHAERHIYDSNFRVTTTISCFGAVE